MPLTFTPPAGRRLANLSAAALVEEAVRRGEGALTASGAFSALTGPRTGRSPKDKFFAREPGSEAEIDWAENRPMPADRFDRLRDLILAYLQNRDLFVFDGAACAAPQFRLPVRVVTEKAWHNLFARCLFLPGSGTPGGELIAADGWTVLHACDFRCEPARDGTRSEAAVAISFERRLVLVAGTHYAGEIKKAIFTALNYLLPRQRVFPMHCAANVGPGGDVALFFGLSGTGKTTLSADPARRLIGDDEHGWGPDGVFNVEGGCYAKTIRLSAAGEPQIWNALRFGAVLENVPVDDGTRRPDFDSERYTENTRAAYPVEFIPNAEPSGTGGHPANVFFLTYDASGVLPPLSRLSADQAGRQFLLGYTAKVAGTEAGVTGVVPEFSPCFAGPFLPLPPRRYADMLREKLARHRVPVWLVNTGFTGGPVGVGRRMRLEHTRALLAAVFAGGLAGVPFAADPVFGLDVPTACPGVPAEVLQPRSTWADPAAYDARATELAALFREKAKAFE
jgi:phosphoenolpyruvate carboxykinase (ATP)